MASDFVSFLNEHYEQVDELVAQYYLDRGTHTDMRRYLYDPLATYSANGGKRHRPVLCCLGCMAVGGDPSLALSAGTAIEHFHTAALIHDDIADQGEMRRGEICLHLSQGIGLAVNDGDLALSQVTGSILADDRLDDAMKVCVLNELVAMTTRTIEGQALDIGWADEHRWDISIDDYLVMAAHKTAYYSSAVPLACGAIIGGGTSEQVEALRSFGMLTGLAFQIQDDLLNLTDEQGSTQKDHRSDITEGKRTLLVVYALNKLGDGEEAHELQQILDAHAHDTALLDRAYEIIEQTGAISYAQSYALGLIDQAKELLASIPLEAEPKELLFSMADYFVHRLV